MTTAYYPPSLRRTNALAVTSLVLGVCGFALIPVVLGHVALRQIGRSGDRGTGLAVTGLVLGYLTCLLYVVLLLVVGGAVWWGTR